MLGEGSLLTAGFNLGWANKRIDRSKLKFPDQFDGKFFDVNLPTSVVLNTTSVSYFDMQVGVNYAYFPNEDAYFNAGYSIHHVNRPRETFFSDQTDSARIPMRHIAFLNGSYKLNDRWIVNPGAYFTYQAKATSTMLGFMANYNLSGDGGEKQLIGGVFYRVGDAAIPMVGFQLRNLRFTFSYDATASSLRNFNNMQGAQEFSLLKNGFYNEVNGSTRQSMCPRF
jgi:type IX secretion system PorP/SprF family membrane protein